MFRRKSAGGFAACQPPKVEYPAAMDRPPRVFTESDPKAQAKALAAAGMITCARGPQGEMRISEKQCLFNQARAAAEGFPSYCLDCPQGEKIKARHPEGRPALPARRLDHVGMPLNPRTGKRSAPPASRPGRQKEQAMPEISRAPASRAEVTPRCLKHPEQEQKRSKKGIYMGRCLVCLQEQAHKSARIRKANNAARKAEAAKAEKSVCQISQTEEPLASPKVDLLAKLPDFNEAWPEDLKLRWLEVFRELISGSGNGDEKAQAGRQAGRQAGTLTLMARRRLTYKRGQLTVKRGHCPSISGGRRTR